MPEIRIATSDPEIAHCFPVMRELRPHVAEAAFVRRVRQQQGTGYVLACLEDGGRIVSVAGFRIVENLVSGRMLYVDDLATLDGARSKGHGEVLFAWLVQRAREEGCNTLELDSGVQRFHAHRFYLARRMLIAAHHFAMKL